MRNLYDKVEARLARGGLRGPRKRPDQCGVHELDVPGHKFLTHFDGPSFDKIQSVSHFALLDNHLTWSKLFFFECITNFPSLNWIQRGKDRNRS